MEPGMGMRRRGAQVSGEPGPFNWVHPVGVWLPASRPPPGSNWEPCNLEVG